MSLNETTALTAPASRALETLSRETVEGAQRIVADGTAPNTAKAFQADMSYLTGWAQAHQLLGPLPLSPADVIQFIVDHVEAMDGNVERHLVREGFKRDFGPTAISTVRRRLATIATAHNRAGLANPCADPQVSEFMTLASRAAARRGWSPSKKAAAALDVLDRMIVTCSHSTLRDARDEALLLFGWASGGRRRSEIAAATLERLEERGSDYVYKMGVTKGHQDGDSGYVPVAGRAAIAMRFWLDKSGIESGPIFRGILSNGAVAEVGLSDKQVARIVKQRARLAGLDPSRYGAHSLRSGFLTQAGLSNINLAEAMEMSLHSDLRTAAGYYQAGAALNNKGARLAG